jgi:hypothetical protein
MKTSGIFTDDEFAKMECDIAMLIARISSSTLNAAKGVKEPYDRPTAMIPAAYAFFEVLVESGLYSGRESDWHKFLQETLNEVIRKSESTYLN